MKLNITLLHVCFLTKFIMELAGKADINVEVLMYCKQENYCSSFVTSVIQVQLAHNQNKNMSPYIKRCGHFCETRIPSSLLFLWFVVVFRDK